FHQPFLFLALEHATQHVAEIAFEIVKAAHVGNHPDGKTPLLHFHLDRSFVQLSSSQLQAQFRSRRFVGILRGLSGRIARVVHKPGRGGGGGKSRSSNRSSPCCSAFC